MKRTPPKPYNRPTLVARGTALEQTREGPPEMPEDSPPFALDEIKFAG